MHQDMTPHDNSVASASLAPARPDANGREACVKVEPRPTSLHVLGDRGKQHIIRRRQVVIALGTAALDPSLVLFAQQPAAARVPVIGLLSPFPAADATVWHNAFRAGLRDLGWVEGTNIRIEYRYADGNAARLPALASELVRLKVAVIVAAANTDAIAVKDVTQSIPIVVASAGDPVASGLVTSLAHPGANITGLSQMAPEMAGKRLELLKEMVPKLARVAVFWNPAGTTSPLGWKELQSPARAMGIALHSVEVRRPGDFDAGIENAHKARADAIAVMPDPLFASNLKRIAGLAAKYRLPSVFHLSEFADAGGLLAYGPDRADMYRRAAAYVDKILKGAKPGELPIEQPTKFELVINQKTAKALGIRIPNSIRVQATRIID